VKLFSKNSNPIYDHDISTLIVTFALSSTVSEILPVFLHLEPIFPYPTPIPAKIWGFPFGVDP